MEVYGPNKWRAAGVDEERAQAGPVEGDGVLGNWPYMYAYAKEGGNYLVTYEYARGSMADVRAAADAMTAPPRHWRNLGDLSKARSSSRGHCQSKSSRRLRARSL